MSNIVATREANALLPSLMQLFVAEPMKDPSACTRCGGFGKRRVMGDSFTKCEDCRGTGWRRGRYPFKKEQP